MTQRAVVALVISAASLFGCAKTLARDTAGSKSTPIVTFDGFGPAKVGMTVVEAEAALKVNFILEEIPDIGEAAQICSYYMSPTFPGVHLMVLKGRIARIDVTRPRKGGVDNKYRTAAGAHLGMTEEEIKRLYPGIAIERHPYLEMGHYLRLTSHDGRYALIFETGETKAVTSYRSGLSEAVALIEGCE